MAPSTEPVQKSNTRGGEVSWFRVARRPPLMRADDGDHATGAVIARTLSERSAHAVAMDEGGCFRGSEGPVGKPVSHDAKPCSGRAALRRERVFPIPKAISAIVTLDARSASLRTSRATTPWPGILRTVSSIILVSSKLRPCVSVLPPSWITTPRSRSLPWPSRLAAASRVHRLRAGALRY